MNLVKFQKGLLLTPWSNPYFNSEKNNWHCLTPSTSPTSQWRNIFIPSDGALTYGALPNVIQQTPKLFEKVLSNSWHQIQTYLKLLGKSRRLTLLTNRGDSLPISVHIRMQDFRIPSTSAKILQQKYSNVGIAHTFICLDQPVIQQKHPQIFKPRAQ